MPIKINPKDLFEKYQDILPFSNDDPFELFVDDNIEPIGY